MSLQTLLLILEIKFLQLLRRLMTINSFTKKRLKNKLYLNYVSLKVLKSKLRRKVTKEVFGKHTLGIVFDTANGLFINYPEDIQVSNQLGFSGKYDFAALNILISKIRELNYTVYVLGTHIGCIMIPLSKFCNTIVGFEANPETFKILQKNILLNQVNNTKVFNYAVTDAEITLDFYKNTVNSGGSKIKPFSNKLNYSYDSPEIIQVEGKRLDTLQQTEQLALPDMMIIDIEGAEYFALRG
ncbi:MAG: FkbM family methyltransferase, partial [Chitinophagaceae bacterium]|nr:FkbM family methyltransferase [Chitinophagaceae bacterium]